MSDSTRPRWWQRMLVGAVRGLALAALIEPMSGIGVDLRLLVLLPDEEESP